MFIGGIDIGGTKSAVSITECSSNINILCRKEIPTVDEDPYVFLDKLILLLDLAVKECGIDIWSVTALGVSCGGPLNSKKGIIICPPNLPSWKNINIKTYLEEHTGIKTYLKNDADAGALAEFYWGGGKGFQNIVFLTFGTGMGAGLILNGRLYEGSANLAGEVGHIRLKPKGPIGYGKAGSFEGFCSGGGINKVLEGTNYPTPKELFAACEKGDKKAIKIFNGIGKNLGRGISYIIDILNPEMIIIGGIYMRAERYIKPGMEKTLKEEALNLSLKSCKIISARLKENIGDYAAAAAAYYSMRN